MKVNKRKETIVGATEEIIKMARENNGTVTTAIWWLRHVFHVEILNTLWTRV